MQNQSTYKLSNMRTTGTNGCSYDLLPSNLSIINLDLNRYILRKRGKHGLWQKKTTLGNFGELHGRSSCGNLTASFFTSDQLHSGRIDTLEIFVRPSKSRITNKDQGYVDVRYISDDPCTTSENACNVRLCKIIR